MASPFSGKAGRNAAIWTAQKALEQHGQGLGYIQQGYQGAKDALSTSYEQSLAPLTDYYTSGQDYLSKGLTGANDLVMQGLNRSTGDINTNYGEALAAANRYYGQSADTLKGAAAGWDPLIQRGMTGYDMYMNSLGLNGPGGNTAALSAFQTGPGYQWNVDQATSQAARAANRTGKTLNGKKVDAQNRLAQNMANPE
jgi:hypothetical protein